MTPKLRYLSFKRDRHGVIKYAYFRRWGQSWKLSGDWNPPSAEFLREYARLVALTDKPPKPDNEP